MENRAAATTSYFNEERGAGGKVRRPATARPSSTPYARPQQNQPNRRRWLSKLVDPAYRLITGGATMIFPSLLSKPAGETTVAEEDDQVNLSWVDGLKTEGDHIGRVEDGNFTSKLVVSGSAGVASTSKVDFLNHGFELAENKQQLKQQSVRADGDGLSKIEQIISEKRFSRDELKRLLDIMHSRAVDTPTLETEQENKHSSMVSRGVERLTTPKVYSGKPIAEVQETLNADLWENSRNQQKKHPNIIGDSVATPSSINLEKSPEIKREDGNKTTWQLSTPLHQLQDSAAPSPIDIAKAYMENRMLDVVWDSKSPSSKGEGSKALISSPAPKSPTCWPGAMVRDPHSYSTPHGERERFGLHSFPRTPYSRTMYSKSRSKMIQLKDETPLHLKRSSTPFQQSYTSKNEQGDSQDYGHGSVGPIRRMRKSAIQDSPRRSAIFNSSLKSSQVDNFNADRGFFSAVKDKTEIGATSSSQNFQSASSNPKRSHISSTSVPSHSRDLARKILEHLERNPPTPKEKAAELKLATSKTRSSEVAVTPNQHGGLWEGDSSSKQSDQVSKNDLVNQGVDRGNLLFKVPQAAVDKVQNPLTSNISASGTKFGGIFLPKTDNAAPVFDVGKSRDSGNIALQDAEKPATNSTGSEELNSFKKFPAHTSGSKPVLPSISIAKPEQRWTSSTSSSGFTFHVNASPGLLSEPPTPSIMPTCSGTASGLQQPTNGSPLPSYTFGLKKSGLPLVFSFPSSSSSTVQDDAADLKFTFGSDKPRISFSSIGKDAICY